MSPTGRYVAAWRALRARQRMTFRYESKVREAYPIILGYSVDGRERLLAYQVGGQAKRGRLPDWKCFHLDKVQGDIQAQSAGWHEGGSHKTAQSCVRFVDVDANIPDSLVRGAPLPFGSPQLSPPRRTP